MTSLALDTYEPIIGPLAEPIRVRIEAAGLSAERGGLTRAMRGTRIAQAEWGQLNWMAVGRGRLTLDLDGQDVLLHSGDAPAVQRVLEAVGGAQPDLLACMRGSGAHAQPGLLVLGAGGAVFVASRPAPLRARTAAFVQWSDRTTVAPLPGGRVRITGAGPGLDLLFGHEGAARRALDRLRARLVAGFAEAHGEVTAAGAGALSVPLLWDGGQGKWRRAWLQASGDTLQIQAAGRQPPTGGSTRRWAAQDLRIELPQAPGEVLRLRAPDGTHGMWRPDDRLASAQLQRLHEMSFAAYGVRGRMAVWWKLAGRWSEASMHTALGACDRGPAVIARLDNALVVAWQRPDAPLPVGTGVVMVLRRGGGTVRARLQLGPEVPLDRLPASVSRRLRDPARILLRTICPLPRPPTDTPRRRRHHRVSLSHPATLTVGPGSGDADPAELWELSLSGARIRTDAPPIAAGTPVRLAFLDCRGAALDIRARVVRTGIDPQAGTMLAMEFDPLTAATEARVHRIVLAAQRYAGPTEAA